MRACARGGGGGEDGMWARVTGTASSSQMITCEGTLVEISLCLSLSLLPLSLSLSLSAPLRPSPFSPWALCARSVLTFTCGKVPRKRSVGKVELGQVLQLFIVVSARALCE